MSSLPISGAATSIVSMSSRSPTRTAITWAACPPYCATSARASSGLAITRPSPPTSNCSAKPHRSASKSAPSPRAIPCPSAARRCMCSRPRRGYQPGESATNNDSLVLHLSYAGHSALLEGDAEAPSEAAMLSLPPGDLVLGPAQGRPSWQQDIHHPAIPRARGAASRRHLRWPVQQLSSSALGYAGQAGERGRAHLAHRPARHLQLLHRRYWCTSGALTLIPIRIVFLLRRIPYGYRVSKHRSLGGVHACSQRKPGTQARHSRQKRAPFWSSSRKKRIFAASSS